MNHRESEARRVKVEALVQAIRAWNGALACKSNAELVAILGGWSQKQWEAAALLGKCKPPNPKDRDRKTILAVIAVFEDLARQDAELSALLDEPPERFDNECY